MADAEKPKGNETIDYLGILLSRWWLILLGTLVCAVAAAGVSLLLPNEYEASAVLLIAAPQFTTELNPSTLPIQTYQRIVQSKGLMEKVLQNMKSRHAEDFSDTTVEDLLKGCRVEVEAAGKREAEAESPLLLLFARHENPAYAKEMADIWVQEFMALNNTLQKKRTGETDQFVSVQFQEAKAKLIEAEKAVTEFRDTAQVESLKQQIEIMSEQAKYIFGQLEANREELESEKETLATLEERIGAVEIEGKWLGQLPDEDIDLSSMNTRQKEVANELLKLVRMYQQNTQKLADLAREADVETLTKRLNSYRDMLVDKDPRLENIQMKRKSLEAALTALSGKADSIKEVIVLKKALPEEVLWKNVLAGLSKEDVKKLPEMYLVSEELNPERIQLGQQILILTEELQRASSEEKHITNKIPLLEEEVKRFESMLRVQDKKKSDLLVCLTELKKACQSRYADYMEWLNDRNRCRINIAELQRAVELLERRHKDRLSQMRLLSTEYNRKEDLLEDLRRGIAVAKHAYELLKNKVEEARITTAQETEDVRLVSSPVVPGKKVAPQRSIITVVAAIVGFLLLSLGAVLLEYRANMAR
jgi:uncharacterized protein involved in exopolysaccharide biosynthesis